MQRFMLLLNDLQKINERLDCPSMELTLRRRYLVFRSATINDLRVLAQEVA